MLGRFVYFCDLKLRKVRQGYILTRTISESGYAVNVVFVPNEGKANAEDALIFDNEVLANKALKKNLEIKDTMDELLKISDEQLNKLRVKVIGEPQFKEIADELRKIK